MKTFTIVIPTYNNLDLFKSAYSSVCKQDFKDYEIVVVDDSDDSSIEDYVSSLNNPVLVYRHHVPSAGAVNNWNHGLQLASGKYVIVLHHDEAFEEDNYLTSLNVQFQKGYEVLVTRVKVFNGGILKPNVFSQAALHFFSFVMLLDLAPVLLLSERISQPLTTALTGLLTLIGITVY